MLAVLPDSPNRAEMMAETKRIDVPCPWCGTRCCKLHGTYHEWACGSKVPPGGYSGELWQSPACRVREIDQDSQSTEIGELKAEIEKLKADVKDLSEADEDEPDYRKHLVIRCNRMCKLVETNAPDFMLIAELELITTSALRLIKNEIFATARRRLTERGE